MIYNSPHDAQYHFVKDTPWNEEDDWFPELRDGADVFLKEVDKKLYWWDPKIRKFDRWVETDKITLDAIAYFRDKISEMALD